MPISPAYNSHHGLQGSGEASLDGRAGESRGHDTSQGSPRRQENHSRRQNHRGQKGFLYLCEPGRGGNRNPLSQGPGGQAKGENLVGKEKAATEAQSTAADV